MKTPPVQRLESLYVFVTVNAERNEEGVVACKMANGEWLPFIVAAWDTVRLEALKAAAQRVAREQQQEIRLVRFKLRKDVEVIRP